MSEKGKMAMDPAYVPAAEAYRKLKTAYEMNTAVYIYGVTGYGKTRLVREFMATKPALWLSAYEDDQDPAAIEQKISEEHLHCVILDDLQHKNEWLKKIIPSLLKQKDIWLVLIGRMPPEQWIMQHIVNGRMIVITEDNLKLSEKEIRSLSIKEKLSLEDPVIHELEMNTLGNAFAVLASLQMIKAGCTYDGELVKKIQDAYSTYLQKNVINQWSPSLQEFLMQISVVDFFTLPMASMITGDDQAEALIEEAQETGNFVIVHDGGYSLRPQLIDALRQMALREYGIAQYRELQKNAGLYYETTGDVLSALRIYKECDYQDGIRSILIRNARRHSGSGNYYELRDYYMALDEKDAENSVVLMSALSLLYSIVLDEEKSEYWYQKLKHYAEKETGGRKDEADIRLIWLDIALPHRNSIDIMEILKKLPSLLKNRQTGFPEFSLTNNQPSVMNGGKDFCSWSRNDVVLAASFGKIVEKLLGDLGKGIVPIALAESFYEKGKPAVMVLTRLTEARMEIETAGRNEMLFVVIGIQIRMNIVIGNTRCATELLNGFEKRIREDSPAQMFRNAEALRCRLMLYSADLDHAEKWLAEAPDEKTEFCTLERYRYLVKIRVYLALGRNEEAFYLLQLLRQYAKRTNHIYILMETGFLLSIVLYRTGEDWKPLFTESLQLTEDYSFIRVISEEGAAILPLLKAVQKEYEETGKASQQWFGRVLAETKQVAGYYPGYLSQKAQKIEFDERSLMILKLQAEGKKISEIAEILDVSERTVKYRAAENYRKLGAKGKTDAVKIAGSLNLL